MALEEPSSPEARQEGLLEAVQNQASLVSKGLIEAIEAACLTMLLNPESGGILVVANEGSWTISFSEEVPWGTVAYKMGTLHCSMDFTTGS